MSLCSAFVTKLVYLTVGKASKKNTKKVSDDTEVKIEKDSVESAAETRISSEESKNEASNKTCDDRSGIDEGSEEEENNCVGQEKTSITEVNIIEAVISL